MGHSRSLFSLFLVFSTANKKFVDYKILRMFGFKLRIFHIGSDRSNKWPTTTGPIINQINKQILELNIFAKLK